jgi:transcriptional regulator with XRE-family HTH domain
MKTTARSLSARPSKPSRNKVHNSADAHIDIGIRLKHARLTKGLSLRQLADEVGCTEGFLSKVENNKARPSLAMLHRLVSRLEIAVARLFSEDRVDIGPVSIMRSGERSTIKTGTKLKGKGIVLERLVSNAIAALIEANIHHVAPKGSTDGCIQHEGEEIGFVLEGMLELIVDDVTYIVHEGDAFFFKSSLPHGYRNPGKVETRVLWVNTPLSF